MSTSVGLLGKKLGMQHLYDGEGNRIPVTVVEAGPCFVTQVKKAATDGYDAVQIGFDKVAEKSLNKPKRGHFAQAKVEPLRFLREYRVDAESVAAMKPGEQVGLDCFKTDDHVDVTGVSKGKGFAGVMKRHGFSGFPATHGTHEYFRHGGSIGCCFPEHTIKGKKMPGQMGNRRVTVQNLRVVSVKPEENLLYIQGALPGARGGYLVVQKAKKAS